jgi:hypothetical protein
MRLAAASSIFSTWQALTASGPASRVESARKLLQRHSSGEATNLRFISQDLRYRSTEILIRTGFFQAASEAVGVGTIQSQR